jgi:hypothetical protein
LLFHEPLQDLWVQGSGIRVQNPGFRVQGKGYHSTFDGFLFSKNQFNRATGVFLHLEVRNKVSKVRVKVKVKVKVKGKC